MQSTLFEQRNLEVEGEHRFALQNPQMLRVHLGADVLALKGSMIAFQGQVTFNHEGAGSMGKLMRKILTSEDVPLMRVAGDGDVFFAAEAGHVYLVELQGDALSINGRNLLAFDAALTWDIQRVKGAGMISAGAFNTVLSGSGTVAMCSVGQPVVLDCSQQPTYVDSQAAVAWSAGLTPQVVSSMNMRSLLRGGTGEAFQFAFHGPGFVVVQPSEWTPASAGAQHGQQQGGGLLGELFR
ncbi:AIM24 family protein [Arsenicicoccus piscis]|uniref:AIM24 family protein n=1 Tax=Arsenicicoccus piscis TaxID=673954 RepID=A0ABQ6HJ55_9MICO|nr:AIM24 family protein [Arsenicicoccus piscis]MCH8627605.1 AIM24 family protein [Arsenicicoccus piscis]GMA18092.1 hypothetical protein GCM10025862_01130 [Arsenicicoccus piscis]